MPSKTDVTTSSSDEIFGGSSLLDRIGTGRPVVVPQKEIKRQSAKTLSSQGAKAPKHQSTKALTQETNNDVDLSDPHIRVSVYLSPSDLDDLDQQVIKSRRRGGRKKDRSELIREAVRHWIRTEAEQG